MAKAVLICGKMCSGKTAYAKSLMKNSLAVLLSADEITTIFFGPYGGAEHHTVLSKTQKYLFNKSLEIIESGIDVILDWGFWRQLDRREATSFYNENHVQMEWHYVDTPDEYLLKNLEKRNKEIETGKLKSAYFFPHEAASRFWSDMFETPTENEIDVWHINRMIYDK